MSLFEKLFGKKNQSIETMLAELTKAQEHANYVQIAKLYYDIGEKYLKEGAEEKAFVYINRFDNLVGSDDALCKKFEKKSDQASEWIGMLEEKPFYAKRMQDKIDELSETLNLRQKMQWNLLTLARFCTLLQKFSSFSGLEIFRQYENIIDMLTESMFCALRADETKNISDWLTLFYGFSDLKAFADARNQIPVSDKASFQACDLFDDLLLTDMYIILDDLLQTAEHSLQDAENEHFDMDFVKAGLLTGYYIRTSTGNIENLPEIKTEQARIESDHTFVCKNPSREEFMERMAEYKKVTLIS